MLGSHVAETLEAQRTLIFVFSQILEAFLVHRMSAVEKHRLFSASIHILKADRAVAFNHVSYVSVVVRYLY